MTDRERIEAYDERIRELAVEIELAHGFRKRDLIRCRQRLLRERDRLLRDHGKEE